jgi:hypothetical protein
MSLLSSLIRGENPDEAFVWAKKAAATGVSHELFVYATHLMAGYGCEADQVLADKTLKEAAEAAAREGNDQEKRNIAAVMEAADNRERLALAKGLLHFKGANALSDLANLAVLGAMKKAVAAPDRKQRPKVNTPPPPSSELVLLDLAIAPSGTGIFVQVDGRVRNASDEPMKSVRVSIVYEDAGGRLITTGSAHVTPSPLPPGAIGTFSGADPMQAAIDHVKLDFTGDAGFLIRWADRSGKHAHQ